MIEMITWVESRCSTKREMGTRGGNGEDEALAADTSPILDNLLVL